MKKKPSGFSKGILKIHPRHPGAHPIQEAISILRNGGLIVFPTETFYGLGADPHNAVALERLYRAKGRTDQQAVSIVVPDRLSAEGLVSEISPEANFLMDHFWPGPLTLLFRVRPGELTLPVGDTGKIGIRVPDHPVAKALLERWNGPLTATSANRTGEPSPKTIQEARDSIGEEVDLLLDAGPTAGLKGSTIVDTTLDPPRLVREGVVAFSDVMEALGYGLTEPHDW